MTSCSLMWSHIAATAAKSLQSCPTLCDPIDCSPSGSPVPGILQARTLVCVAISFSKAWKWKVKVKSLSRVRPSATPRTAAFQAPPSMGFSRQECWSGVPLPTTLQFSKNILDMYGRNNPFFPFSLSFFFSYLVFIVYAFKNHLNFCMCLCGIRHMLVSAKSL